MRRTAVPVVGLGCLLGLLVFCNRSVLFEGEQFAYRDLGRYYYPLYLQVQREWSAGRLPLWDSSQNSGMPLLGNPTAAVLYPGKLVFALVPYAWGARLYIISHTLLAGLGMTALGRSLKLSWTGSFLGGLCYAFGAPVLCQYCNVIFLVGTAWAPFGFRAIDRFLRLGRRWGLIELAAVLALQTLGGDPEAALVTALCGAGYAVGLAVSASPLRRCCRLRWMVLLSLAAVVLWVVATLGMAARVAGAGNRWASGPGRWAVSGALGWSLVWCSLALTVFWVGRRRAAVAILTRRLTGLVGAGVLSLALAAACVLPVLEFTIQSVRATGESRLEIDAHSVEPYRVAELFWPGFFGKEAPENSAWIQMIPPMNAHRLWVPSLYLGGLALVLALSAAGFRGRPAWCGWLTAVALVGLVASFGKFGGPLWWVRWVPSWVASLGPHDPIADGSLRTDGFLPDGTFSLYNLLATVVPGFGLFRYPGKLLPITALAIAGLAGGGWDRVAAGHSRRAARITLGLLAVTVATGTITLIAHPWITDELARRAAGTLSIDGPVRPSGALTAIRAGLGHGCLTLGVTLWLVLRAYRWPRTTALAAMIVLAVDLGVANAPLVWTVPQSEFDRLPRALRIIEDTERHDPSAGPFRIHRMPNWHPEAMLRRGSPRRQRELVAWERDTLQPGYASTYGLDYTLTVGVLELDDYLRFFRPRPALLGVRDAGLLGVPPGQIILAYPRRAFDLWNTKYFILPARAYDWTDGNRSFASFLSQTEMIYPKLDQFAGSDGRREMARWRDEEDWQVFRNKAAYPRAWIVHEAIWRKPIRGTALADVAQPMISLLFQNDLFWTDPDRPVFDPRRAAWVETDDRRGLAGFAPGGPADPGESVVVTNPSPQRVELRASLTRPGLVILSDVFYPGWRLTIDGKETPVLRSNRMMRGAPVGAGLHFLVYTYEPMALKIGGVISVVGLMGLLILSGWARRRPGTSWATDTDRS